MSGMEKRVKSRFENRQFSFHPLRELKEAEVRIHTCDV